MRPRDGPLALRGRDRGGVEGYMRREVKGKHGLGINPFSEVFKTISSRAARY